MISVTGLIVSLSVLTSAGGGYASSMATREEQEAYLKKYAYLGSSSPDPRFVNMTDSNEMFKMAVMKFQMMTGVNRTGVVCEETMKMMAMPRCGLPDEVGMSMAMKRRRRRRYAAQGARWLKTGLTYRINNYTPDLQQAVTDKEIQSALKMWSDNSPLTFTKTTDRTRQADIKISFGSRNHGDRSSFDGPGGVLAHAYFPQSGEVHFDEDEQWTSNTRSGINLLWVAIHEFGHSLGLSHSDVNDSIMFPYYRGYKPDVRLHSDDIAGIQYIYGSMMRPVRTTQRTTTRPRFSLSTPRSLPSTTTRMPPSGHDICRDPKVDAIFAVNEDVYIFKGDKYYMAHRFRFMSPALAIQVYWRGLPSNIDTAVYLDGFIVFFKGHQFWRFSRSRNLIGHNPQNISSVFAGLPNNIDAAFVWSGNGKLYIIKGDKYYRMSKNPLVINGYRVDPGYPRSLSTWRGLPSKIDAAFNYTNGRTYFFSGSKFYRFNDIRIKVDSCYPKSTAFYWLGCLDRWESAEKDPEEDMMEEEWMAGGNQFGSDSGDQIGTDGGDQFGANGGNKFLTGGVGLPNYSVLLSTTAALVALCLILPIV